MQEPAGSRKETTTDNSPPVIQMLESQTAPNCRHGHKETPFGNYFF